MKFKRIVGLGAVVSMIMASIVGCGTKAPISNDGGTAPTDGGSKQESSGEVFKIGGIGPTTGENASYGLSVKQGAQIAVDEINAAGGINGLKFELSFLDDASKADQAISVYNKLMDEKVNAILGAVTSVPTIAITDLTKEDGILQITPSGSAQDCTKYDNGFRICFTDPLQGTTMADFVVDELKYSNIAVLYDVSDDYSSGMMKAFVTRIEEKGAKIAASESFTSGDVDFNTQLTTIKNSGAEVIFIPAYYTQVAYIANQAKKLSVNLPMVGGDGWDGVLAQVEDDPSVVEGAIFLSPFIADDADEKVVKFVESYKKAFGQTPDQFAADGYDGVYVMAAALKEAGTTNNEDLIQAMTKITVEGITGTMTFTPEGEPNKLAKMVEIKDGKYTARK